MPAERPLPTVIGPTENALRALLERILSPTPIPGYSAWVVLNAVSTANPSDDWRRRAANGLGTDLGKVEWVLAELQGAGLVDDAGALTSAGIGELANARAAVRRTTLGLVEGIDEAAQETTRQVLDLIRRRAEGLLGG